jgi:hypothetical protein
MVLGFLKTGIQVSKSSFFLVAIFFFSFFTTYYFLASYLLQQVNFFGLDSLVLQSVFHFFAAIVLLVGSFLIRKINKIKIIYVCSIVNSVLMLLLLWNPFDIFELAVLFCMVVFVSIGMLTTFAVFGSVTVPEERGRIGGLIGFVVFPFYFMVNYFLGLNIGFFGAILLGFVINLLPLFGLLLNSSKTILESGKTQQVRYYEKRVFILYFIPWIVFSLINATLARNTTTIIQTQISSSLYFSLLSVQIVGIVFGVLFGGLIADILGRRFSLVFSLTFFGFCTALVGIFTSDLVFFIVYGASGLTWGFLFVLYIFVVWGDLSNQENRLQVYSIGLISYFLSLGLGSSIEVSMSLPQSALLSVLIIFAPELLPSYVLEKIRMKMHMGAVKKLQKKNQG